MLDLLAATVDDLAGPLDSRTRAAAVRRSLLAKPPQGVPARVAGVRGAAWERLRAEAFVPEWKELASATSADGTTKLALRFGDASVETVLIRARGRSTVCVSSQAGCSRHCDFCATARLGLGRNLRAGEIVLQYLLAAQLDARAAPRNVVFMGMGEPLDNLEQVLLAVRALTDVFPGLSPRRVTVSTAGVLPAMRRFLSESDASLALSLNATTDELRTRLMPHNRRWPIDALLGALREAGRRSFIEYVLLAGVNDLDADARRLAELLGGLDAQVNLIPHNAFPGSPYRAPARVEVRRFQQQLRESGVKSIVRSARGAEIAGACGQLALSLPRA
jgi:23S rRNA (adenine2503-C2)-methyltransferase